MAAIIPFRALRPEPDVAARVASVPYDVVNTDEARALASGNPLSFLRVSRAEIECAPEVNPYSEAVYARAVDNLKRLTAEAPMVMEAEPSLYVYRLRMGTHVQTGIAGCYSLDEYEQGLIKKHEKTRSDKEDDRTRHMVALRAQTGPVFLTYRTSEVVHHATERALGARPPLFDFTAPDEVQHTMWRVESTDQRDLVTAIEQIPTLYIADGHHRAASAARARQALRATGGASSEWDTFLAVAFPDAQLQVLPYNRVVKDLAGRSTDWLLAELRARLDVTDGPAVPARRGEVAMFDGRRWHTIVLGEAPGALSPAERLDVARLQETVLGPLLGVGDQRSDKRIEFVGGARGTSELEAAVTSGRAAVAFSMYPASVTDLMLIADAGGIMPPKSTWFEPKLRDGLLSHVI